MHDPGTSRDKRDILDEIAKILNASCKWGEMTNRAAQICGKRNSPQLCAAGFLIKGDNSVALSKYVNELDFVHVKTLLKELCEKRGFLVLILPKYHCELNPIEMIWGRSKFHYRQYPPSKKEDHLVQNVENALAAVTIDEMRR